MPENEGFGFSHGFAVTDEVLVAIGCVVVQQAKIELYLSGLIHNLANMDMKEGDAVTSGMSFKALCVAIGSLVVQVLEVSDERYKQFRNLMGKLQHFEEFRNQVAHSNWLHLGGFPSGRAVRIKTTARQLGVKYHWEEMDIEQISEELAIADRAVVELSFLITEVTGRPLFGEEL